MELVDMISESMELRRKDFIERVGVETDEEYQVEVKNFELISI